MPERPQLAPRVDKTNEASRDEVFAVGAATPRVECARRDGSREAEVREDALIRSLRITHETHTRALG